MTSLITQLLQMKSTPGGMVHLMASPYSSGDTTWTCFAEGEHDGTAYKITGNGSTPSAAAQAAWDRWIKLTNAVPEFLGALPPPEAYQDAEHMVTPFTDDDIPF